MTVGLDRWPTTNELRCGGVSMIIAHIMIVAAAGLATINYSAYDVNSADDIVKFHNTVSSAANKFEVKIGVALCWLAFPLLLLQNLAFRKLFVNVWSDYHFGVYLFDRAYIVWIVVIIFIVPSLALISVSHDWDFDDGSNTGMYVYTFNYLILYNKTGYYVQLYSVLVELELIDCASIADAVIMTVPLILWVLILIPAKRGNQKYEQLCCLVIPSYNKPFCKGYMYYCAFVFVVTFVVLYFTVLFEFADSGLMALDSPIKMALFFVFVWKVRFGVWLIWLGSRIDDIQQLLTKVPILESPQQEINYQMTSVVSSTDNVCEL